MERQPSCWVTVNMIIITIIIINLTYKAPLKRENTIRQYESLKAVKQVKDYEQWNE